MKKAAFCAVALILSLSACGNKGEPPSPDAGISRIAKPASVEDMLNSVDKFKLTLIELGSDNCRPCRMMTPILEKVAAAYTNQVRVVFFDVWKSQAAGQHYQIQSIPTQIILDATGREIFRHVGYYPYEELNTAIENLLAKVAVK